MDLLLLYSWWCFYINSCTRWRTRVLREKKTTLLKSACIYHPPREISFKSIGFNDHIVFESCYSTSGTLTSFTRTTPTVYYALTCIKCNLKRCLNNTRLKLEHLSYTHCSNFSKCILIEYNQLCLIIKI